jgi:hypothetical protein
MTNEKVQSKQSNSQVRIVVISLLLESHLNLREISVTPLIFVTGSYIYHSYIIFNSNNHDNDEEKSTSPTVWLIIQFLPKA